MSNKLAGQNMQGGKGNNAGQIKRAPNKMEGRKVGHTNVKKGR